MASVNDAVALEFFVSPLHGDEGNEEFGCESAKGRKSGAGLEFSLTDCSANAIDDLLI